ncbi:MAG: PLP-dependent transferase [Saprospiraceae bacterium]|nr:PLP-dependent transferase [Saprospiraceae bacterium]
MLSILRPNTSNGHGNSIAGIIIGHEEKIKHKIWTTLKLMGATCNAWDAWLINNGLKTLSLRMAKHAENAMNIASGFRSTQEDKT